jgi:hypothetical protein
MRDIRADLQDRANLLEQQISAENTRFESIKAQGRTSWQAGASEGSAANKLLDFTAWQDKVRAALAAQIACAEAAENSIGNTIGAGAKLTASSYLYGSRSSLNSCVGSLSKSRPPP